MPFNDHESFGFADHLGLFDRGESDSVPADHFVEATNLEFSHKGWNTRHGFLNFITLVGTVVRIHLYQRAEEAPRYLYLDGAGNLRDTFSQPAVLINVAGAGDFSCISLFNRAYITFHDRITGKSGSSIYMYDGTNIRLAAGLAPVAPTFNVTVGTAGSISRGFHLFSVAYETDTGFITKPGPVFGRTFPLRKRVTVNNIPIGPTGTVARHILASKVIVGYNGNPANYALFFLTKINDNVTTTLTNYNFIDSSLVTSADYLLDLLETIPAGVALAQYQGSLVSVGEFGKESVFRVSLAGQPEAFDSVDGFGICYPGDGGGLRNVKEYRGNLYLFKENRTFSTRSNGDTPTTWTVILVDAAIGTGCFGLSQTLDSSGDSRDNLLVASTAGLMQFYGRYTDKPLSWKIENIWAANIDIVQAQVCIDPDLKRIYIIDGTNTVLLVGDISNGLSPDDIRWSTWLMSSNTTDPDVFFNIQDIIFSADGFMLLNTNGNNVLMQLTSNNRVDFYSGEGGAFFQVETVVQFPFVANPDAAVAHHNGFRAQIKGVGILQSSIIGADDVINLANQDLTVTTAPGQDFFRQFNIVTERASFRFFQFDATATGGYIANCAECSHFAAVLWETRPA